MIEVDSLNSYTKLPKDILIDLITFKIKLYLYKMITLFNKIIECAVWEKKLIFYRNSLEQNNYIYKNIKY